MIDTNYYLMECCKLLGPKGREVMARLARHGVNRFHCDSDLRGEERAEMLLNFFDAETVLVEDIDESFPVALTGKAARL